MKECALMGEVRKAYCRRLFSWEDNTKMDLKKVGCEGVDWI
jgi:hypothetical protein